MWRSKVLLPQPLPPIMMNTSPRLTCALMSHMTTNEPNAIVRSRISILMSREAVMRGWAPNSKGAAGDGEQTGFGDDQRDTGDDGGCGGNADGGGVRAALHPAQAAGQCDDAAEKEAFENAQQERS